jgi:hypothetical protein
MFARARLPFLHRAASYSAITSWNTSAALVLEPTGIAAGLHLVAYLPSDLDEKAVVDAAARTIVEGIETLADAIAEVRSQAAEAWGSQTKPEGSQT